MVRGVQRGLGLVMVAVGLGAMSAFPQGPVEGGWITPIVAFELARTPSDLAFLAGPGAEPMRAAMDTGHVWDTAFPLLYATFLAACAWPLTSRARAVAFGCALLAAPMDLWENHVLGGLLQTLRVDGDVGPGLAILTVVTWTKWTAIAVSLAALGWGRRKDASVLASVSAPPVVLVPLALVTGHPVLGEALALGTMLAVIGWLVDAWRPTSGP